MTGPKKTALKPYSAAPLPPSGAADRLFEEIMASGTLLGPRKADKPVVLYGAGSLGLMAKNFFDCMRIPFRYVVDKNADKYRSDPNWAGVEIVAPARAGRSDKENCLLVVCIVTTPQIALRDELKRAGWRDIAFFYDVAEAYSERYPLNNGWFLGKTGRNGTAAARKVYRGLDAVSRAHYLRFLAWRRLRVELLSPAVRVNGEDRFFIPEVAGALGKDEVFADCGAYVGEVSRKFYKLTGGRYRKIFAIEPDGDSFARLQKNLEDLPDCRVLRTALAAKKGTGNFCRGFGYASKLKRSGASRVKVVTLDGLQIPATFIKMHLEGGELDALKGALATVRKYRPVLAVTIYHNSDGAWKIPLFLMENTEDYVYHLRLHSWGGTGAVVYAVPAERAKKAAKRARLRGGTRK